MNKALQAFRPEIVDADGEAALLTCMEVMRAARLTTLTDVLCFLHVCDNPGLNVGDLSRRIDMTAGTVSRAIRAMAPRDMPGARAPFLGLVEMRVSHRDLRDRFLFLTEEGQSLKKRLEAAALLARDASYDVTSTFSDTAAPRPTAN